MWFQVLSAMTRIKAPSALVARLHVNTNTPRIMGDEPFGQAKKQFRRNATASVLWSD
jgi:hypothetical protein